jgi:hypothetical protein
MTTAHARIGTRPTASLHRRSVAKVGMNETCRMSSTTETHTIRSRTGIKNETVSSLNDVRNGTVTTMALITLISSNNVPQSEDAMKGESELSIMT